MQRLTQTRKFQEANGFHLGVQSGIDPLLVPDGQVRWAVNAVCKGGIWQTRPGFKTALSLSVQGFAQISNWWVANGFEAPRPQFLCTFQPTGGDQYLVFGLSGSIWTCKILTNHTLAAPVRLASINFDPAAEQLFWCRAVQSQQIINNEVVTQAPKNVLIIQDGSSRACYWDGTNAASLNPTQKWNQDAEGNTLFSDGYNQTPIGRMMAWSGNRLWVAAGSQVFASDVNNPLGFTEQITLVNVPVVNFPAEVTAVYDRGTSGTSRSQVMVFTDNQVWTLHSGVQAREQWKTTTDWQAKIFDGVGCIAPKSVVSHRGLLHWYSADGIVSFDGSGTITSTQALPPRDAALVASKVVMIDKRQKICAGVRDSYVAFSVPAGKPAYGHVLNGQTQVLDTDVIAGTNTSAWQGIWTGINPVEWCTVRHNTQDLTYALSLDDDGNVRIWEAFQGSRADNGQEIPWMVETRAHRLTESLFVNDKVSHIACNVAEVLGNLKVEGHWRGMRGQYHKVLDTWVTATPGSILAPSSTLTPLINFTPSYSCRKQGRILKSEDVRGVQEDTDASGVEGPYTDAVTPYVQVLWRFLGRGALRAYRIASDVWPDNTEGEVAEPETGLRVVPADSSVDPWREEQATRPDYDLVEELRAAAFVATDMTYSEEEYAAPPVDDYSAGYEDDITTSLNDITFTTFVDGEVEIDAEFYAPPGGTPSVKVTAVRGNSANNEYAFTPYASSEASLFTAFFTGPAALPTTLTSLVNPVYLWRKDYGLTVGAVVDWFAG